MASRTEGVVVNVAGLVQGIVLVTFPAASTIFTAKSGYGLSSSQYGDMFLPQVVTAIAGHCSAPGWPGGSPRKESTCWAWPAAWCRWGCCSPA